MATTTFSIDTTDPKFATLQPKYEAAFKSAVASKIVSKKSVYTTVTYEPAPRTPTYIEDTSPIKYIEKTITVYVYEINTVSTALSNLI